MMNVDMDFNAADLVIMNVAIAFMMFGVSLQLKGEDFTRLSKAPMAPATGLVAQFLFLPAVTAAVTWALSVPPEFALGMILVASCPGGTFSNIMTWLAKGNVAVSVTMTAVSSLAAVVMTPLNFSFYGLLNPHTAPLLRDISISPANVLGLVTLVLALPIFLGMGIGKLFPDFATRSERPMRSMSLLIFFGFIVIAISRNFGLLLEHLGSILVLVAAHNSLALLIGYSAGRAMRLSVADRRAVTMEVGIQNSGLGLVILFTFFPEAGGMILITAGWGIWHLISGLTLANVWARRPA